MESFIETIAEKPALVVASAAVSLSVLSLAAQKLFTKKPTVGPRVVSAQVEWGESSSKHLGKLVVKLPSTSAALPPRGQLSLDVYGRGVPVIASLFLPLQRGEQFGYTVKGNRVELHLGKKASISRASALSHLAKLTAANHTLVLELLGDEGDLNRSPVPPSILHPLDPP